MMSKIIPMKKLQTTIILFVLLLFAISGTDKSKKIKAPFKTPKEFVFVPAGEFASNEKKENINAFFISESEVSNTQYREFLADLKAKGKIEDLKIAIYDSSKWNEFPIKNKPYVDYYHWHPAYNNFPVVNIGFQGALLYCKWATEKLNQNNKTGFTIEVRLPTEAEWTYAAKGGNNENVFAWEGPFMRNRNGQYLANFKRFAEGCISINPETGEAKIISNPNPADGVIGLLGNNIDIGAPVKTYWANAFGAYNMCGNVAEMVSEKGIVKGGSYISGPYEMRVENKQTFEEEVKPLSYIGFRPIMTFTK